MSVTALSRFERYRSTVGALTLVLRLFIRNEVCSSETTLKLELSERKSVLHALSLLDLQGGEVISLLAGRLGARALFLSLALLNVLAWRSLTLRQHKSLGRKTGWLKSRL